MHAESHAFEVYRDKKEGRTFSTARLASSPRALPDIICHVTLCCRALLPCTAIEEMRKSVSTEGHTWRTAKLTSSPSLLSASACRLRSACNVFLSRCSHFSLFATFRFPLTITSPTSLRNVEHQSRHPTKNSLLPFFIIDLGRLCSSTIPGKQRNREATQHLAIKTQRNREATQHPAIRTHATPFPFDIEMITARCREEIVVCVYLFGAELLCLSDQTIPDRRGEDTLSIEKENLAGLTNKMRAKTDLERTFPTDCVKDFLTECVLKLMKNTWNRTLQDA